MKIIVNHCKILTFAEMSLLHDETILRFLRNKVVICQGNDGKYVNYADFEERVKNWLHNEIGICCMERSNNKRKSKDENNPHSITSIKTRINP